MQTTQFVTYALAGIVGMGLLGGGSKPQLSIQRPTPNEIISATRFPYSLHVSGTFSGVTSIQVGLAGDDLTSATIYQPATWTASLPIPAPGPYTVRVSGKDSAGNTVIGTVNFEVKFEDVIPPPDWKTLIGVNWIDPVLKNKENIFKAADAPYIKTWIDNLAARKVKLLRVPVHWEAMLPYATQQPQVLAQIEELASACEAAKILWFPSFFTFVHTAIPSSSKGGNNHGLPAYVVQAYSDPAAFYDAFYSNSISGVPNVWQELFERFWQPILEKIDSYRYVLGYELYNEPPIHNAGQIAGLGNFHTDIATRIRNWGSQKYILFCNGFPGAITWNIADNARIKPQVSDVVFAPHNYATGSITGWQTRFTNRTTAFANVAAAMGTPAIMGEFGLGLVVDSPSLLTQANMNHALGELKRLGMGGTCWVYFWNYGAQHNMVNQDTTLKPVGTLYFNARQAVHGY